MFEGSSFSPANSRHSLFFNMQFSAEKLFVRFIILLASDAVLF